MTAYTGTVTLTPRNLTGTLEFTSGTRTVSGAAATADTITFSNFFPADGVTVRAVKIFTDKEVDTNGSPGTFIVGDGTDDDGYVVATSMGTPGGGVVAFGTGAQMNVYTTKRDLVITLGTIGTGASAVTWYAEALYAAGDMTQP